MVLLFWRTFAFDAISIEEYFVQYKEYFLCVLVAARQLSIFAEGSCILDSWHLVALVHKTYMRSFLFSAINLQIGFFWAVSDLSRRFLSCKSLLSSSVPWIFTYHPVFPTIDMHDILSQDTISSGRKDKNTRTMILNRCGKESDNLPFMLWLLVLLLRTFSCYCRWLYLKS